VREIAIDDPRSEDVRALLERHLAFAQATTAPEHVHALDVDSLVDPQVAFYSLREDGVVLAVGALKKLAGQQAELKSMHTAAEARGRGLARAMLENLIGAARERGLSRLSLETGSFAAFAPARSLYESAGFTPCEPFADYCRSDSSAFLTLVLNDPAG
jgi:putative acetyltransferase